MLFSKLFKKIKSLPYWRCLTCEHFCWWDRDYCCIDKMKILVESPGGRITKEEYNTLCKQHKRCWSYKEKYYIWNKSGLYVELDKLIKKVL